jgi:hypothetical protein
VTEGDLWQAAAALAGAVAVLLRTLLLAGPPSACTGSTGMFEKAQNWL